MDMTSEVDLTHKSVTGKREALVIGQVMLAFLNNLRAENVKPLLEAAGLTEIDPQTWYPQQTFVDIYKKLEKMPRGRETIIAIGYRTLDVLEFPPEVHDVESALHALPEMYRAIHRGIPEDEGWAIHVISDDEMHARFTSPYSDYAAYGYLFNIAQRFRRPEQEFMVKPEIQWKGAPALFRILFF